MSIRRRAFTLVELLVVIGIIALLVGILLPTLTRARAAASRVQCLSNQRQLMMAVAMYQNRFKGSPPDYVKDASPNPGAGHRLFNPELDPTSPSYGGDPRHAYQGWIHLGK